MCVVLLIIQHVVTSHVKEPGYTYFICNTLYYYDRIMTTDCVQHVHNEPYFKIKALKTIPDLVFS